jgi:hypothetical protein
MKLREGLMLFFRNFFFSFAYTTFCFALTPYDLSYLLPLPESEEQLPAYLNANDILGTKLFQNLSNHFIKASAPGFPAIFDLDISPQGFNRFLALAYRFDPCFKDVPAQKCQFQVRITLQPITQKQFGFFIIDSAVHVFFVFKSEAAWRELMEQVWALNQSAGKLPQISTAEEFYIHPHFQTSDKNLYQVQFQQLVLKGIKNADLTRVAFLSVEMSGVEWLFQTYEKSRRGGDWKAIPIPLMGGHRIQGFTNILNPSFPREFEGSFRPVAPKWVDQLAVLKPFLTNSLSFKQDHSMQDVDFFTTALTALSSATQHLPGTVDCLSCHAAPAISQSGEYLSGDFIMFGYKGRQAFISPRVFAETNSILHHLSGQ